MRVIIGKAGKSRALQSQMELIDTNKTLMIDSVGLNVIAHLAKYHLPIKSYSELIITLEKLEEDKELLAETNYVVLSLNALFNDTDTFLNWENRLAKKFIVTVQEDQIDRVLVFDMMFPE